jgi:hypothetical protein
MARRYGNWTWCKWAELQHRSGRGKVSVAWSCVKSLCKVSVECAEGACAKNPRSQFTTKRFGLSWFHDLMNGQQQGDDDQMAVRHRLLLNRLSPLTSLSCNKRESISRRTGEGWQLHLSFWRY